MALFLERCILRVVENNNQNMVFVSVARTLKKVFVIWSLSKNNGYLLQNPITQGRIYQILHLCSNRLSFKL